MRKQKLPKNSGIGTLVLAKAHKGSSQSHLAFLPNSEFYHIGSYRHSVQRTAPMISILSLTGFWNLIQSADI